MGEHLGEDTPEGEDLGEDTPVGEHLDSLVGEELHVDNLVEKQLQTMAGITTTLGRCLSSVQGSLAEQGGSDRQRGCNHLVLVFRAGMIWTMDMSARATGTIMWCYIFLGHLETGFGVATT